MKREFVSHFAKVTVLFAPVFFLLFTFPLAGRLWANLGFVELARAMTAPTPETTSVQAARAEMLLRRTVTIEADHASAWRGLGFALAAQGREEEAIEAWRNADTVDDFVQWGMMGLYQQNDGEAFRWFRRAVHLTSKTGNRDALYGLGRVYANQADWEEAIQAFQRALDAPVGQVGRSEIFYRLGRIYQLDLPSPDEERAWQYYEQALALDEFGEATWAKVETYYRRGQILSARKEWKAAAQEFQQAATLDPTHYWACVLAGSAFWQAGEHEAAKAMMRRAINLKPDKWHAYQRLGRFYQVEGDISQAKKMFAKVLEIDPQNQNARKAIQSLDNHN